MFNTRRRWVICGCVRMRKTKLCSADEPSRPVIVADAQTIFLERKSCPDQRLYAYVSVFRGVIYCDSFPIVSLISNSGIFYSMR